MKKQIYASIIFIFLCLFLNAKSALSQGEDTYSIYFSVPEIAILDIEPEINNSIEFSLEAASEPGGEPDIQKNSNKTLWINYSSALSSGQNKRNIKAQITNGTIPDGVSLFMEISDYTGTTHLNHGNSSGRIKIDGIQKTIISNIGNCFTGDGTGYGHEIDFSIEISSISEIAASDQNEFTVMYTISDN